MSDIFIVVDSSTSVEVLLNSTRIYNNKSFRMIYVGYFIPHSLNSFIRKGKSVYDKRIYQLYYERHYEDVREKLDEIVDTLRSVTGSTQKIQGFIEEGSAVSFIRKMCCTNLPSEVLFPSKGIINDLAVMFSCFNLNIPVISFVKTHGKSEKNKLKELRDLEFKNICINYKH